MQVVPVKSDMRARSGVYVLFCMLWVEGQHEEREKMNMLYVYCKILHGPPAWEEPRAECL